eukprot:CAMPEP_0171060074 /NCGR_PEP_ID=MMETSP0766_2-20121228/3596_1 /TAXON_ID=439317 /ORGANISM="Gambierdiscus australes, Strain CAWD 149" /LENGTH=112 /DNA_ID=CAMNT_0011515599 /DNA_START=276 /DNA_END=615 /DNA_ORIENTATION=-
MCSTSHAALGCCGLFCCGQPYAKDRTVEDRETQFMEDLLWLCYCCFCGFGCSACNQPCCFNDLKLLWFAEKDTSDDCWTDEGGCCDTELKLAVAWGSSAAHQRRRSAAAVAA